ncbi:hypothetical protein HDU85_000296 [Gaertneriomyces sp. JEL0708]|nr:hypothetical protein HDU85_000296 [Gaertneriomyces sp. JEL0708]
MSVAGERVLIGGIESLLHDGMDRGCLLVRRTSDWRCEVKHGGYHIERLAHCGSYVFHLPPNASSVKLTSLTNPLWISCIPSPPGVRPTSLLVHQSALYIGATDGSVKAYTFAENHAFSCAHVFRNHAGSISCLAADESGSLLVSASDDATICVRDLALGMAGGTVTAVIRNVVAENLDVRGKLIAYTDKRKMRVVVWDVATRQAVLNLPWKVLECGESPSSATASEHRNMSGLVVRLSNQYLLVANNGTLHFFPLMGGRQTQPLRLPASIVSVSLIKEKLVVLTSPGTCHTYTFTARGDLQTETDRMLAEAEANSLVDSELGAPMAGEEEGDWDSEGSELGYGDYGAGFVPRGKKYWRC